MAGAITMQSGQCLASENANELCLYNTSDTQTDAPSGGSYAPGNNFYPACSHAQQGVNKQSVCMSRLSSVNIKIGKTQHGIKWSKTAKKNTSCLFHNPRQSPGELQIVRVCWTRLHQTHPPSIYQLGSLLNMLKLL